MSNKIDKHFIRQAVRPQPEQDEEVWRTSEEGHHFKLETETGEIKAGFGGKFNGQKIDPSKKRSSSTGASERQSRPMKSASGSSSSAGALSEYEFRLKYKNAGDNAYRTLEQLNAAKEKYKSDVDKWVKEDLQAIGKTKRGILLAQIEEEVGGDPMGKKGKEKLAEWAKKRHPIETQKHETAIHKLEREQKEANAELGRLIEEARNRPEQSVSSTSRSSTRTSAATKSESNPTYGLPKRMSGLTL